MARVTVSATPPSEIKPALTAQDSQGLFSGGMAGFALALLFLTSLLNWYDRSLFAILLEPIKHDLSLSDGQIGLLSGLAFNLLSILAVVPIARIGDRGSHAWVLSISLAVWSALTILCGTAGGFLSLFLFRMGVGLGEAGGTPATHALISGRFNPDFRTRALSIVGVGSSLGILLGTVLGGITADALNWRWAFWLAGAPGLALAVMLLFVFRQPRPASQAPGERAVGVKAAVGALLARPAYRLVLIGMAVAFIGYYAAQMWLPTFLIRTFGITVAKAGVLHAGFYVLPSIIGTIAGGILADWWGRRDRRAAVWVLLLGFGASAPFLLCVYTAATLPLALVGEVGAGFLGGLVIGPLYGLVQSLAGRKMRATAASLLIVVGGLVGGTLGPMIVGFVSDWLQPSQGANAIRIALSATALTNVVAAFVFYLASRTVVVDLDRAAAE